tara:strand:+ start:85 stop:663 length:579 start_codon:yes stop_codon:yes gene_type:complete
MGKDLNKPLSKEELEKLQKKLKGKGGSPGQIWKKASLQIRPNQIMLPFVPKEAETDDMYGEGVDKVENKQASVPLRIRGRRPANTIGGRTHIDSPAMDLMIDNFRRQQVPTIPTGPELPSFLSKASPLMISPDGKTYYDGNGKALGSNWSKKLLAENKLSTPHWDKQKKIQDYLNNDRRLRERGLLGGTKKA